MVRKRELEMDDKRYMRMALQLAKKGLGQTSPNPMVGAVVVSPDGAVVGSGFHAKAGESHAEIIALRQAADSARGATLYVTLEPCAHHGRTPPCTEPIIAAGITRVVAAMEDPDPRVKGSGFAQLRAHGIRIDVGEAADQAQELNRIYIYNRRTGLPFITLKMAQTLDGKIGPHHGERVTLTGKSAARYVRALRFEHDAIMVGAGTVRIDDPQLTVRPYKQRAVPYTRVIVDARGQVSPRAKAFKDQSRARTIVLTTTQMPAHIRQDLQQRGVALFDCIADAQGLVDLKDGLKKLAAQQITSILCEGGPALAASLLREELVSQIQWLIVARFFGDGSAASVIAGSPLSTELKIVSVRKLGDDVLVSAVPKAFLEDV